MTEDPVTAALGTAYRDERPMILASLARRLRDIDAAEDALQEAFAAAARRWPVDGVPDRPGAWLTTTAWRSALDRVRRDRFPLARSDPGDNIAPDEDPALAPSTDDLLVLMFTCCHPALGLDAQVALTLRHVVGLDDAALAARFFLPAADANQAACTS